MLLLLASCRAKAPESALVATLEPHAPLVPFARETITIRLENKGDRPLALVGEPPLFDPPGTLEALPDPEGLRLAGTLLVDDVGAEARAPLPPRMAYAGDARLTTFPLLAPGASTQRVVPVVARPGGEPLKVQAVALGADAKLLTLAGRESLPMAAPETRGGFRSVLQDRLSYKANAPLAAHPLLPLPGPSDTAPLARKVYPQGVSGTLPAPTLTVTIALPVAPTALPLADARAQADVAEGPAVWLERSRSWVLEGPENSRIVDATGAHDAPGHWAKLAEAVAAEGRACVTLFDAAAPAQAEAVVAPLRAAGLEVTRSPAKGGGERGGLCLRAESLEAGAAALGKLGMRVEGMLVQ